MLNIPDEKLPEFAKDDDRVTNLFSPLRSRTVNPKDWEDKISSWKCLISLYCVNNSVYSFSLTDLQKVFVKHGRPPSCLAVVLSEMIRLGEVQLIEEFLKKKPQTWSGWAADLLVKRPLNWGVKTVRKSLFSNDSEQVYVHLDVIKAEANKLFCGFPDKFTNKLINFTQFCEICDKSTNQIASLRLLLHYLANEGKVDTTILEGNQKIFLIKLSNINNKLNPISEVDVGIYTLEQNEKLFKEHIAKLEDDMESCRKEAKFHLSKNHRQLAKTCLRRKHELEKRLERKINALNNIQVLLEKIRDVHQDADVWQSYKTALEAFHATYQETGMTEEAVEDTMLKLGEMLDVHQEIETAISQPIEECEDLEQELAELIKEEPNLDDNKELEEEMAKIDLNSLPKVPKTNVSFKVAPLK